MQVRKPDDKQLEIAKRVVLEIVRKSPGDEIDGKTRLFKAFYFAHLFYAKQCDSYLTEWPVVKMPLGPGIDDFETIVEGLVRDGLLEVEEIQVGPYPSTLYRATPKGQAVDAMAADAADAVRQAVEFVADKSGAQLSDITHEFSKTWNEAKEGEELPIYLDLLSDDEYRRARENAAAVESKLKLAWG